MGKISGDKRRKNHWKGRAETVLARKKKKKNIRYHQDRLLSALQNLPSLSPLSRPISLPTTFFSFVPHILRHRESKRTTTDAEKGKKQKRLIFGLEI
jgi:hypothetical protein